MKNRNECSIIVCSCDKYSDLWFPYFELFKKFWKGCPYPIFLNTETKTYETEGLNICVVNAEEGKSDWSSRLIHTLKNIDTDFVLLTMDDHFLLRPVDGKRFAEVIAYMQKHPLIGAMSFFTISKGKKRALKNIWIKIGSNMPLRVNCSTTIWRKKRLLALLREGENAWEFEGGGTARAVWDVHRYYRFVGAPDWPIPILDFAQHVYRGYGVFQGKWLWKNGELFKEHGLDIDLSLRGVLSEDEFCKQRQKSIDNSPNDWRDGSSFWSNAYRHLPVWLRKLGSRIKGIFRKK